MGHLSESIQQLYRGRRKQRKNLAENKYLSRLLTLFICHCINYGTIEMKINCQSSRENEQISQKAEIYVVGL